MSEKEIDEIDRFEAVDASGKTYTIVAYQEFIVTRSHSGNTSRIPSLKRLETIDGKPVNFIRENTFDIVDWENITVTRI